MKAWRIVCGVLLVLAAGLTASLAVVAVRAQELVGDTDTFVATYAPVVRSAPVQQVLTSRLTDAILAQVGIDNRVTRPLVTRVVTEAAASDAFADATAAALRLAHTELVAQLTGAPGRLQVDDGVIQLRFAPFVDALTQRLSDAGVPFLDRLPEISGGITLATIDPQVLAVAQTGYRALSAVASWLPWLGVLLGAAAVGVWPGVRRPLIALGLSMLSWVVVVGAGWWWLMGALQDHLGADLAAVATQVAGLTGAPAASPLLAIGIGGAVLATLAALTPATAAA